MGDMLLVAVLKDGHVHKGRNRPMFTQNERMDVLRAIAIVDDVVLVENPIDALAAFKPAIWCIGFEYKARISAENAAYCRANHIEIRFTSRKTYSSTKICNLLRQDMGALLNG